MKKMDFLFIFLAILLLLDYLTTVVGLNMGLVEKNIHLLRITGIWEIDLGILTLTKLAALAGLYVIFTKPIVDVRRATLSVSIVLAIVYLIITLNNAILIASASSVPTTFCDVVEQKAPDCSYSMHTTYGTWLFTTGEL